VAAFRAVTLAVEESRAERLRKLARIRAGQLLGLLFLIGPFHDLGQASLPAVRLAGVVAALAVFVSLYLALLPPISPIARRGQPATLAGLAALAVSAGLALALGAPGSFAALFIYFVAAAGIVLPVRGAIATIAVTAAAVGGGLAATGSDSSVVWAHVLTILAIGAVMGSLGRHARTISELRAARHELARLAVAEERLRIARDLHDLLGHTLSVIALKSELAAKLVADEPQRAHDELGDVQRVARQALTEVREAVHGYRRLAFSDAVAGARAALSAAGIDVRVQGSAEHLPDEVESVLAWAVREATTNVVRHSGASACAITVAAEGDAVALQVEDDGRSQPASAGGAGLAGLAERARRLHGTLEAGARPEGGFRLRLSVPLRAA